MVLLATLTTCSKMTPIFPDVQWQEATPASQNVDPDKLEEAVQFLKANSGRDGIDELAIVRNGYLIWYGQNIDKVHGVWSVTKSFTSTVLGLLIEDGKCTLDTLAQTYIPSLALSYPDVTLRHLTTMTSGYRALGDEPLGGYKNGPSRTPFLPSPQPLFAPGEKFAYWDSAMNQLGNALTQIAGEPLQTLFQRRIAEPIGMNPDFWRWGNLGEVDGFLVNGGAGNNEAHIYISARELARFGYLFLHRGNWNGKQLLDASWIQAATSPQVPTGMTRIGPVKEGPGVYGYNWWVNGRKLDATHEWPAAPLGTFSASGYNANDMFVIPEWNMVIVRLGLDQEDRAIDTATYNIFLGKIAAAVQHES